MIRSTQKTVIILCWLMALGIGVLPARAIFDDAYVRLDPASVAAIVRAQKWIAENQNSAGSWGDPVRYNAGQNAYAILALMVNGSVAGEGPWGREIALGVEFLVNVQAKNGLIAGKSSGGPMYQHALATLVLAESYGMTQNQNVRSALIRAVDLIVDVQGDTGGWRYEPKKENGDISVTVMQVMALRAAADSGIYVPRATMERAVRFIRGCYSQSERGFGYMLGNSKPAFPRSAAGLVCMQTVGLGDDPSIPGLVDYILETYKDEKQNHYWYGQYYTSVGLYQYGGEAWKTYYPDICAKIQRDWEDDGHYKRTLETSWAVLVLGVPYRYLPIYQR